MKSIIRKSKIDKVESEKKFLPLLRTAFRDTIFSSESPPKEIARRINISYQLLVNSANKNLPFKFSLAKLFPLLRASGNFSILKLLAEKTGHCLCKIPCPNSTSKDIFISSLLAQTQWHALARNIRGFILAKNRNEESINKIVNSCSELISSVMGIKVVAEELRKKIKERR